MKKKSVFTVIFVTLAVIALVVAANTQFRNSLSAEPTLPAVKGNGSVTLPPQATLPAAQADPFLPQNGSSSGTVYFTSDISSAGMMKAYYALGVVLMGNNVAVKLSTGETGSNYLAPALIQELVQSVNGTIVECNTAYGGTRASTALHYQLAKDHGFADIARFVVLDENGYITLPVRGGTHLQTNRVGAHFPEYDYYVVLSHFKGHIMAGFGGALKNISIGLASADGKSLIHTAGASTTSIYGASQDAFLESMAEAAKSVVDYMNGRMLFINVMNKLSVDCDCDASPAAPTMQDIGILASFDPVALDQACIDLVYAAADGQALVERITSKNGLHILEQAQKLGVGSRSYTLVNLDG